jgi:hypothetical protein
MLNPVYKLHFCALFVSFQSLLSNKVDRWHFSPYALLIWQSNYKVIGVHCH